MFEKMLDVLVLGALVMPETLKEKMLFIGEGVEVY